MSGKYFDLMCEVVGVAQEEFARLVDVSSSTLSRTFAGQQQVEREKLVVWGDHLLELCPEDDKDLLRALLVEMFHTLGYATREDKQKGIERFADLEKQVDQTLAKRRGKSQGDTDSHDG